jgi:hypothetical protein
MLSVTIQLCVVLLSVIMMSPVYWVLFSIWDLAWQHWAMVSIRTHRNNTLQISNQHNGLNCDTKYGWVCRTFKSGLCSITMTLPSVTKCDQVWPSVTKCDQVWSRVTKCDQELPIVTKCYQVLPSVTECDQVWPSVTKCDQVWPSVTKCDQVWPD